MVRHFRLRAMGAATTAVAVTVLAAACSSSTSSGGSTGPTASSASGPSAPTGGNQALNPGTGSPKSGGTLNEVGVSDVKFMDYDVAYYSTDDQMLRLTVRQLYSWGNTESHIHDARA